LVEDFDKVVKEIDEMLFFRHIDQLIKKNEEKNKKETEKKTLDKSEDLSFRESIKQSNKKEEIFIMHTKRIKKTIRASC